MLLIYTHQETNRVKYAFNLIFKSVLEINFEITTDADRFKKFSGAKISYTIKQISDEVFFRSSGLLFESGLRRITELPTDSFALSFFLATRYEEYSLFKGDKYGRFSAKQSLTFKNNFLQKPLVNICAEEIRKNIAVRYPDFSFPVKKYLYTPTIDIDNAYAYLGKNATRKLGGYAKALIKSDMDDFSKRKRVLAGKESDPYDTYDLQFLLHKKYHLKPVYFFLLGDWATNDKNLPHTHPLMQTLIKNISQKSETGIHPSFASNQNPEKIKIEKGRLEKIKNGNVTKSRQHFLMLKFPQTCRNLIAAGITDDYTMGFADEIGFRAGICTPYKFYDLEKEEETNLTIHPFAVMDGTLNNYLKLSPEVAIEKVKQIVQEIKNVNGEFITIWHNETLSDWREWKGWKEIYEKIIQIAQ
ncbi:MAG: polysaccharide deacetylase family protein [Bacteroidetes bacterium]|nr:polysaccharide deacetylase family protein [Bacteroidota bacterium]